MKNCRPRGRLRQESYSIGQCQEHKVLRGIKIKSIVDTRLLEKRPMGHWHWQRVPAVNCVLATFNCNIQEGLWSEFVYTQPLGTKRINLLALYTVVLDARSRVMSYVLSKSAVKQNRLPWRNIRWVPFYINKKGTYCNITKRKQCNARNNSFKTKLKSLTWSNSTIALGVFPISAVFQVLKFQVGWLIINDYANLGHFG